MYKNQQLYIKMLLFKTCLFVRSLIKLAESKDVMEGITVDDAFVEEYSSNPQVIKFMQTKFKSLSRLGGINLIKQLLFGNTHININDIIPKYKRLLQYNITKFNKNKEINLDLIKELRYSLNGYLAEIGKDIVEYDKEIHKGLKTKEVKGERCFVLEKNTLFRKTRKLICDEGGTVFFHYDFDKPDMDVTVPSNEEALQRCQIQILGKGIKFDYPVVNEYTCWKCRNVDKRKAYETASSNGRVKCSGIYNFVNAEGEPRSRVCNEPLVPDGEVSLVKDTYYYDIGYENKAGDKFTVGALAFGNYSPGFYEAVLFKVKNPKKTELYHIVDVKEMEPNKMELPIKVEGENYIFTLQKCFDDFIKQQADIEIYGLFPIKVALILQYLSACLKMALVNNIQIVGDASTGKSIILKYYGFLLNSQYNLSTNGLSISIPAMRGTKQSITLMGKEVKIITTGYLGTYTTIHIDEAGENRELVQNLKTFLLEENYGYDKAGATGVFNRRTAQVNISENLDFNHLGQYRGTIRKAYKDDSLQIGEEEKPAWDEKWDLHLPLFKYENKYLYKVVDEKRTEYKLKMQFWIDGYDYALHERFLFYFYLANDKQNEQLSEAVKRNVGKNTIRDNLELMQALRTNELAVFFKGLIKYKDIKGEESYYTEVDKILESYGLHADSRVKTFYYNLVKLSRIINQRKEIIEEDYKLLQWILEKTNCKLDVADTVDYDIAGPPDIKKEEEKRILIEDETKATEDTFGMPEDEFK